MYVLQVNEAEEERLRSEREHMRVTHACQEAEARVQMLQKSLKRVIVKSKPYFELKAQFNHILEVIQRWRVQKYLCDFKQDVQLSSSSPSCVVNTLLSWLKKCCNVFCMLWIYER